MKVISWVVAGALAGIAAVGAEQADIEKLKAEKQGLEASKKELQASIAKALDAAVTPEALAKERAALLAAQKAVEEKKQTDRGLVKARSEVAEAEKAVAALVDEKMAKSKDAGDIAGKTAAQEARAREISFQKKLLQLKLNHPGSPVQLEIGQDAALLKLQQAAVATEAEVRAAPSADVLKARKAAQEADGAFREASQKIGADRSVAKAADAEREARAELKAAEEKDKGRAAVGKARDALAAAEKEALAGLAKAKPHLKELEEVARLRNEANGEGRALAYALDVHRKAIAAAKDRDVLKAADAVADAGKDYSKALESRDLAKLKKAVEDASAEFDAKHEEFFGKNEEYKKLTAKEQELTKKLAEMDGQVLKATSARALRQLLPAIRAAREELAATGSAKRSIRIGTGKEKWDAVYVARSRAVQDLDAKVRESAKASEARQALNKASAALDALIAEKLANDRAAAAVLELQKDLDQRQKELRFREAVAELHLRDGDSEIAAQVQADRSVVRARKELAEAQAEQREKPSAAISKAAAGVEAARQAAQQARAKLEDADFQKVAAANKAAEAALRAAEKAETAGPAKVAAANKAVETKKSELMAGMKAAKSLLDEVKVLDEEVAGIAANRTKMAGELAALRKKISSGDDADVAAALKKVEAAKAAAKDAEKKAVEDMQKGVEEARKALEARKQELQGKDKAVAALREKAAALDARMVALNQQIRDAEKAAKQVKAPEKKAEPKKDEAKPAAPAAAKG